ncbi:MAG: hypothetical protein FJX72_09820 [Armatimonadetes bacterium]|nr:hypothetical protein [Armatimonadota bacterium]
MDDLACPGGRGQCPACRRELGGCRWLPPHRIELSKAKYGDFVWGAGIDLLMSARALEAYREAGLTGIFEVVRVGSRKPEALKNQPPEYHEVIYRLDGADLDDERSQASSPYPSTPCPVCNRSLGTVKGVLFRKGSWRRADIFGALGLPEKTVITEPFRAVVLREGLVGCQIVPAERYWKYREPYTSGFHLCDPQDPGDSEVWFPPQRNLPVVM